MPEIVANVFNEANTIGAITNKRFLLWILYQQDLVVVRSLIISKTEMQQST